MPVMAVRSIPLIEKLAEEGIVCTQTVPPLLKTGCEVYDQFDASVQEFRSKEPQITPSALRPSANRSAITRISHYTEFMRKLERYHKIFCERDLQPRSPVR